MIRLSNSLSIVCLLGFSFISFLNNVIHIFLKIGLLSNVVILLTSVSSLVLLKKEILVGIKESYSKYSNKEFVFFSSIGLIILCYLLIASITPGDVYDEGLYYIQFTKWLESYPAVPGLGNIHGRLAFNSAWHLLGAVFHWNFLGFNSLNDLNLVLYILTILVVISSIKNLLFNDTSISDVTCLILISFFPIYISYNLLNSMNADVASTLLIWHIVLALLKRLETKRQFDIDSESVALLCISILLVTIKFSNIAILLLLLPFIWTLLAKKQWINTIYIVVLFIVLVSPWIIRNIIQSGYFVYPIYQLGSLPFDWAIPIYPGQGNDNHVSAFEDQGWIKSWAKIPFKPYEEVLSMPFAQWTKIWFDDMGDERRRLIRYIMNINIGYILFLIIRTFNKKIEFKAYPHLIVPLNIAIIYWFFTAPDMRFAFGPILSFVALGFATGIVLLKDFLKPNRNFNLLIVCYFIGSFLLDTFNDFKTIKEPLEIIQSHWLLAPQYKTQEVILENEIYYPKDKSDQCWNAPIPCSPHRYNFSKRGADIQSGFRSSY